MEVERRARLLMIKNIAHSVVSFKAITLKQQQVLTYRHTHLTKWQLKISSLKPKA